MTTVVIVDNEQAVLNELASGFSAQRPCWQVHVTNSAEQALAVLQSHAVDCVVSDINLPGMNGAQLLCHVAQHQPDAVRIALSAQEDAELTLESVHATHRFIAKPDSAERVISAIERSLELRGQLHDPGLRSLITGITSLPILPEIYDRLMLELASEDFSIAVVTRIIESDISLSATLLKVVNSAYYGLTQHVQSPSHAVSLLGIEMVKNILLSEKIVSQFKQFAAGTQHVAQLNIQASIRGVLANRFARLAKLSRRQIDHCQMAGMLSALGELVVISGMVNVDDLESHDFHQDAIGSSILGLWSLPDAIVEAVLHQSSACTVEDDIVTPLQVLHAIRSLETAYAANDNRIDENFQSEMIFANRPRQPLLQQWFDCYCDYQLDLKLAA